MPIYSLSNGARRLNLLFVHVPKTGGTAIDHFFRRIGFSEHFGRENRAVRPVMICPPQHYDYNLLNRLIDLDTVDFSFAIVRHPLARIISDYKWAMTQSTMADEKMSFGDWLDECFRSFEKDEYFLANHIKPQSKFIGPKIKRVFKYEEGLDHIISTVLSETDVRLPGKVVLPKINTSSDVAVAVSEDDKAKIRDFYADDFETYGYD